MFTHQPHEGHDESPEEGGEDTVGQISHHQSWTYNRGEQPLSQREENTYLTQQIIVYLKDVCGFFNPAFIKCGFLSIKIMSKIIHFLFFNILTNSMLNKIPIPRTL